MIIMKNSSVEKFMLEKKKKISLKRDNRRKIFSVHGNVFYHNALIGFVIIKGLCMAFRCMYVQIFDQSCKIPDRIFCLCVRVYLWVDVQYADASCLHHLMYGVDLDSIEAAIVLSVLKVAPVLDIGLHLAAAGEGVHPTFPVHLFGFSGRIWRDTNPHKRISYLPSVSSIRDSELFKSSSVSIAHARYYYVLACFSF